MEVDQDVADWLDSLLPSGSDCQQQQPMQHVQPQQSTSNLNNTTMVNGNQNSVQLVLGDDGQMATLERGFWDDL